MGDISIFSGLYHIRRDFIVGGGRYTSPPTWNRVKGVPRCMVPQIHLFYKASNHLVLGHRGLSADHNWLCISIYTNYISPLDNRSPCC